MPLKAVSHYRIAEKIGAGSSGELYRAYDAHSGRQVAVRILPIHVTSEPATLERLLDEIRSVSSIFHPNVASIYDFGEFEGVFYLVTEYLEGETLADKIASGPLPMEEVVQVALQIGRGLAAAHEKHIVHGDLTPWNILITSKQRALILGLGLSSIELPGPMEMGNAALVPHEETLEYMAPERLRSGIGDERSDIFSYGTVLYEMATGRPPFGGKPETARAGEVVHSVLHAEAPRPSSLNPEVPDKLDWIIMKSLRKNPDERFHSMEEMLDALRGIKLLYEPRPAAMPADELLEMRTLSYSPDTVALSNRMFTRERIQPGEFRKFFARLMLGLTSAMILVGLVPLRGTVLGFGMAFGASLLAYECFLLLKASRER